MHIMAKSNAVAGGRGFVGASRRRPAAEAHVVDQGQIAMELHLLPLVHLVAVLQDIQRPVQTRGMWLRTTRQIGVSERYGLCMVRARQQENAHF